MSVGVSPTTGPDPQFHSLWEFKGFSPPSVNFRFLCPRVIDVLSHSTQGADCTHLSITVLSLGLFQKLSGQLGEMWGSFTSFWSLPGSLASLVFSLLGEDLLTTNIHALQSSHLSGQKGLSFKQIYILPKKFLKEGKKKNASPSLITISFL